MTHKKYEPGKRGCYVCKEIKFLNEFPKHYRSSMGRADRCRSCDNKRVKKRTPKFIAYRKEKAKRESRRARLTVIDHYGGSCKCCLESRIEFLAIDHINGGGAKKKRELGLRSGTRFYKWVINQGFPSDLRILCHNCNMARGFYGYCPHDKERAAHQGQPAPMSF